MALICPNCQSGDIIFNTGHANKTHWKAIECRSCFARWFSFDAETCRRFDRDFAANPNNAATDKRQKVMRV